MRYRELGRTGCRVSEIGFGGWAIGGTWGAVDEALAREAIQQALEAGISFFDTADVYGDGRSERLIGEARRGWPGDIFVATKAGRRLVPHTAEGYTRDNLVAFVQRSLRNLGCDSLDLLQLHCPPGEVYRRPEVFAVLDDLVREGSIRRYGVSVERIDEAFAALEQPGVASVQIVFNMFRQRPAEELFAAAKRRGVGIIARVPLASGLLSGRMRQDTRFAEDDHRRFNRAGARFDVGETFSGVDFAVGLQAVEELRPLVPEGATLAQLALRWILMFDAVTCAIPGARDRRQAAENAAAADLPPLDDATMAAIRAIYDRHIRPAVHHRW